MKQLKKFLVAGEGRVDQISGYMDGFEIWKHLFQAKVSGIIRGDEGFGWVPVNTPYDVRRCIGATLLSDFSCLKNLDEFDLQKQRWPKNLQRKEKESLATWRDRLYHDFRIPYILAALTDLKCCYVEIINPLLSRKIIEQIRKLPDHLRTNKKLFKKIVCSESPKIRFAKRAAIESPEDILKTERVVNLIYDNLNTTYARTLLSNKLIEFILVNIKVFDDLSLKRKISLKALIKPYIPDSFKNVLRNTIMKQEIDYNKLAFRAFMICQMNQILSEDASALNQSRL